MAHVVRAWRTSRMIRFLVLVVLFGTATQLLMSQQQPIKNFGNDRLVSVSPLPAEGEMCEMVPVTAASHEEVLMAALQQRENFRQTALAARSTAAAPDLSKMKPVRWIRDPYAAYSSIAVDP